MPNVDLFDMKTVSVRLPLHGLRWICIETHTRGGRPRCCMCLDGRRSIAKHIPYVELYRPVDVPVCAKCEKSARPNVWGMLPAKVAIWAASYVLSIHSDLGMMMDC